MMFLTNIIFPLSVHHLYNVIQWFFSLTLSLPYLPIIYIMLFTDFFNNIIFPLSVHHLYNVIQ